MTERTTYAEASAWLAQLHGPERSTALESDFRAWLTAAPEHRQAFERVTDVWDSIDSIKVGGLPRLAYGPFREKRPRVNLTLAAAAIAAIAVGVYGLVRVPAYVTDIGEQRIVNLADGSRVSLNSVTRIKVRYRDNIRSIDLEEGEALFEVARSVNRPFVVTAGDRRVTALGTSFVVRRQTDRVAVTLLQGKVSVAPAMTPMSSGGAAAGQGSITLNPGQRLVARGHYPVSVDQPQIEATTAWQRGEVILDETPLSEAVSEMNRYDRTPLVVGPELEHLPVSGIYRTGNNQDFAHAVATLYQLRAIPESGKIILKRAR